ncbi:MAG: YolD-like family protein [Bacillota bacterium]
MPAKMFNQFLCSSLMLPEHREALNRHAAELRQQEKSRRPSIDEQQHELWDRLIGDAIREKKELSITCLDEKEGTRLFRGVVCRIDPQRREIIMREAGSVSRMPLDGIVALDP